LFLFFFFKQAREYFFLPFKTKFSPLVILKLFVAHFNVFSKGSVKKLNMRKLREKWSDTVSAPDDLKQRFSGHLAKSLKVFPRAYIIPNDKPIPAERTGLELAVCEGWNKIEDFKPSAFPLFFLVIVTFNGRVRESTARENTFCLLY